MGMLTTQMGTITVHTTLLQFVAPTITEHTLGTHKRPQDLLWNDWLNAI